MYKIKLNTFEGPLDLLLFFIRRDELDIYDIPISRITKEFIEYLNLLEKLDLEIAGDFLLMAATLMQIKVRMLLPREIDEKGEAIDPRMDLVNALIEYKRYKEMSEEFSFLEANHRKVSYRGNYDKDEVVHQGEIEILLKNVTIYDLIKAFQAAIMEKPKPVLHEVKKLNVSIDEQIDFILNKVKKFGKVHFLALVKEMKEKIRIVVTFIALLELVKMGKIGLNESSKFNDFEIYALNNG
ncbi:MAG: segregation/condensation protein A [Ignavibacteriales bacterium]|nr:segregation/condensation protein A [Ignavibacteriales bacterium]MBK7979629.1 segregation/condensation protein A [Ignavibacteriota bacterium]